MIAVKQAKWIQAYQIWIEFSDHTQGTVDLLKVIQQYPIASPLLDPKVFANFYLDEWPTLAWECGFDLAPEYLYELATGTKAKWAS